MKYFTPTKIHEILHHQTGQKSHLWLPSAPDIKIKSRPLSEYGNIDRVKVVAMLPAWAWPAEQAVGHWN